VLYWVGVWPNLARPWSRLCQVTTYALRGRYRSRQGRRSTPLPPGQLWTVGTRSVPWSGHPGHMGGHIRSSPTAGGAAVYAVDGSSMLNKCSHSRLSILLDSSVGAEDTLDHEGGQPALGGAKVRSRSAALHRSVRCSLRREAGVPRLARLRRDSRSGLPANLEGSTAMRKLALAIGLREEWFATCVTHLGRVLRSGGNNAT
jgi:hypothetical protein